MHLATSIEVICCGGYADRYDVQVDGSETGETIPLRPLIVPARKLDFIVVYDASLDGAHSWVNGTNLISKSCSPSPQ